MDILKTILYSCIMIALFACIFFIIKKIGELLDKYMAKLDRRYQDILKEQNRQTSNQSQKKTSAQSQKTDSTQQKQAGWQQYSNAQQTKPPKQEAPKQKSKNEIPECLTILGFTKVPENVEDIKVRYKKLAKIYHPDGGGSDDEFKRVDEAYQEARKIFKF